MKRRFLVRSFGNKWNLSGDRHGAVIARGGLVQRAAAALVLLALTLMPMGNVAYANPLGGIVTHGDVEILDQGGVLSVFQNSDKAIINWQSFSISAGELTQFLQPSNASAALNRVTGGLPSSIQGALRANGQLILLNPNGILVGASGRIDTAGFIASTLDLADGNFLAGGDLNFTGSSTARVVNLGSITAIDGGDIFLIANQVTNQGTLTATEGTVGLAAGSDVEILAVPVEGERVFVRAGQAQVDNQGTIEAATAELKAHGNAYAMAVNNGGVVRATGVERRGGQIFLGAGGGGKVSNQGTLRATDSDGGGGRIVVKSQRRSGRKCHRRHHRCQRRRLW